MGQKLPKGIIHRRCCLYTSDRLFPELLARKPDNAFRWNRYDRANFIRWGDPGGQFRIDARKGTAAEWAPHTIIRPAIFCRKAGRYFQTALNELGWGMIRLVAALLILITAAGPASPAPFRWFWDRPHQHRHHHTERSPSRSGKDQVTPFAEPETDCTGLLAAEKEKGGPNSDAWKRQLSMLTDGQRANVAKCLRDAPP
jgi:hypothetical protein